MLVIRLQRTGRTHAATFRVVVTDSKNSPKSGNSLEVVGSSLPQHGKISFKADRVKYWLSKGAKASHTIHNHLIDAKIVEGEKRNVIKKRKVVPVVEKKVEAPKSV